VGGTIRERDSTLCERERDQKREEGAPMYEDSLDSSLKQLQPQERGHPGGLP